MNKPQTALTAALLAVLLAAIPMAAGATPAREAVPAVQVGDTLDALPVVRSCMGVRASVKWLYQAIVQGMSLNLRLYDRAGEQLLFQEDLGRLSMETNELRLTLWARDAGESATLEIDQRAVDRLSYFDVTEIVVAGGELQVLAIYSLADIALLREGLGLADGELLCLSGEDAPVSVVSVDGIRRLVN